MEARVVNDGVGSWMVVVGNETKATGMTNNSAWRMADRINREAMSRAEDTSEWIMKKNSGVEKAKGCEE